MVIVPTIISDPSDLKRIHDDRMQEMRDFADQIATKKKEYMGQVDYRKKSGILQQMNTVVSKAKQDRELLEKTTFDQSELDLIGPPETHDIEYDPYQAEKERRETERARRAKEATVKPPLPAIEEAPQEQPEAAPAPEGEPPVRTEPDAIDLD
jgi:hypothetical protein